MTPFNLTRLISMTDCQRTHTATASHHITAQVIELFARVFQLTSTYSGVCSRLHQARKLSLKTQNRCDDPIQSDEIHIWLTGSALTAATASHSQAFFPPCASNCAFCQSVFFPAGFNIFRCIKQVASGKEVVLKNMIDGMIGDSMVWRWDWGMYDYTMVWLWDNGTMVLLRTTALWFGSWTNNVSQNNNNNV